MSDPVYVCVICGEPTSGYPLVEIAFGPSTAKVHERCAAALSQGEDEA